jgi:hypothetical protein
MHRTRIVTIHFLVAKELREINGPWVDYTLDQRSAFVMSNYPVHETIVQSEYKFLCFKLQ